MKKVLTRLECPRKAFFEAQRFAVQPTKSLMIKKAMLEAIREEGFWDIDTISSMQKHFETIDEKYFQLKKEKELELKIIKIQLKRMLSYLAAEGYMFVGSEISGALHFQNDFYGVALKEPLSLRKTFDVVLKRDGRVYVCKLSRRAPELTMKAGNKNHTGNSIELFLMQLIGEAIYPGETVVPTIISLTRKDENSFTTLEQFELNDFEGRAGQNIYTNYFTYKPFELVSQIASLANLKIDYKSEKNCKNCGECEYRKVCDYDNSDDIPLVKLTSQEKTIGTPVFTQSQLDVITFDSGDARVLAGAGSGKTTALINRVIYLLLEHEDLQPKDFLMITFTEKGVKEMKEKLAFWLSREGFTKEAISKFEVYTFNGFGQKILDENYRSLGFIARPRLIERIEQIDIIKEILEQYPVLTSYNYRNPLLEMFRAKGVILDLAETIIQMKEKNIKSLNAFKISFPIESIGRPVIGDDGEKTYDFDYATCFEMYEKYLKALKDGNLIDYSDQLYLTLKILEDANIAKQYTYKHIVMDEFQDTSEEQLMMIKRIRDNSECLQSLLACGDDAQAIFSFRGVGLENILEFPKYFRGSKSFYMVDNFRSTREIVALANHVIEFSPHNIKKDLIAQRDGEKPKYVLCDDSQRYVAEAVKKTLEGGVKPEDIAIIARTRAEIQAVNAALKKSGVPTIMSVSERLIDNQRVIGIISLARFLMEESDTASLMQWLEISDYQSFINEADLSKYVGIQKQIILDDTKGFDDVQLMSWFKLRIDSLNCQDRAVDKLKGILKGFSSMPDAYKFLDKMDVYRSEISVELDDAAYKAVTLTTVHSAKGREFKHVFVIYDKFKAEGSRKGVSDTPRDEEVRLLFVAVTRAMNYLTIVSNENSIIFARDSEYIDWINIQREP